jgi:hypothetical protein
MKIQVFTAPNITLKGDGIDDIDLNQTASNLIKKINRNYPGLKTKKETLIYLADKGESFSRIFDNDPMTLWYGANIGDIFRITNSSTMRYRKVVKSIQITKSKDKANKEKFSTVSAELYYKAHNSVIDMLRDRQGVKPEEKSSADKFRHSKEFIMEIFPNRMDDLNVNEFIVNRRGKCMFVYYVEPSNDIITGASKIGFRNLINSYCQKATDSYNSFPGIKTKLEYPNLSSPSSPESQKFNDHVEIIIIYNNDRNSTPYYTKEHPIPYITFFSVQSIPVSLPYHVEQPEFHLLTPRITEDRDEIRDTYSVHGIMLDPKKKLSEYNIKSTGKIIYI